MLSAAAQDYWEWRRGNTEIDYKSLSDDELGEMYQRCAYELEKRKAQKQSNDWKKVIEPLREYVKKYGVNINETPLDYTHSEMGEDFYKPAMNDDIFDEIFHGNGPGVISVE